MKYTRGKNPGSQSAEAKAARKATQLKKKHPWRQRDSFLYGKAIYL